MKGRIRGWLIEFSGAVMVFALPILFWIVTP